MSTRSRSSQVEKAGERGRKARRTVNDVVGEPDASCMRAHDDALLGRHEEDGEDLVDACEPARVDLADVDRLGGEELLEEHAVVAVLARSCKEETASALERTREARRPPRRLEREREGGGTHRRRCCGA